MTLHSRAPVRPAGRDPHAGDGAAGTAGIGRGGCGRVHGVALCAVALIGAVLFSSAAEAKKAPPPANVPVQVIVFPQRDFVSASGFAVSDRVSVDVLRGGSIVATSAGLTPQDDTKTPGFDGIVEVNHPGGGCWSPMTPNIVPGDVVRTTTAAGVVSQTVTANVTASGPAPVGTTVQVHGTAQDAAGNQLPLASIEARLIAKKSSFASGKRDLRAPRDGTIAYDDATGPAWTATWTLAPPDLALALGAESRALWLGADPAAGTEATIFEFGAIGGPAAPCTA